VRGYSAGDVNPDGSDLAFARGAGMVVVQATPDASETGDAARAHAIDSAQADEGFFHHADEVYRTEAAPVRLMEAAEVEDRIADELAGTVIGDVSATIDFVKRDTVFGEQLIRCEDIGSAGIASEGENRRVFEEKERVVDKTSEAHGCDFCLEPKSFVVAYAAKVKVLNHHNYFILVMP